MRVNGGAGVYKGFNNGAELRPDIPDYCNDLNAMHEAEEQMDEIDWVFFMTELATLVRLPKQAEVQIKQLVHATARQRAEAFLRTLGKWEEVQG